MNAPLTPPSENRGITLTTQPEPAGKSGRFVVTARSGITSFFRSLSPGYVPGHLQQPNLNGQSITMNAMPPAVSDKSVRAGPMTDIVRQVGLASKVASCWVPSVKVVSDAVATLCSSVALAQELGSVILENRAKATDSEASGRKQNRPANRFGGSVSGTAAATLALVAMDRLSGAAAVPSAGTPGSPENPILVGDSETLGKIGQEGFPADAYYRQTDNFSHNSSVSAGDDEFNGYYDGDCFTISDPRRCLFHKLGRYSEVRNLRVANADINNADKFSAALACEMEAESSIRDVRIEDARVINSRKSGQLDPTFTGVITGRQKKGGLIERVGVKNSSVSTSGDYSPTGIGAGRSLGKMNHLNVKGARVTTSGSHSDAGIGAGEMEGQIERLSVMDSQVKTRGKHAHAGVGGGEVDGDIQHLTVSGANISTHQVGADAGIGGGMVTGNINNMTVVNSRVTTLGNSAYAGIGGGQVGNTRPFGGGKIEGSINELVALDSYVRSEGNSAAAGIGAGYVHHQVSGTTAINCSVSAGGRYVHDGAAIGAGYSTGTVINTRAVNCTVTTDTGQNAGIAIGAGSGAIIRDFRSLNSRVNGTLENIGDLTMPGLCRTAAPRLVTSNCQVHPDPVIDNPDNCSTTSLISERGSVWNPIPINDSKTFNKIGLNADYPSDAHYIQTGDLDGSGLKSDENVVFSGHYDGQKHTVDQQKMCLFRDLRGSVHNLQLVNAQISAENQAAAVVACTMDGTSQIENIRVANASVAIHGDSPAAGGIITAQQRSEQGRIENVRVHNCSVETEGRDQLAGIVAGQIRGQADDITVQNSRLSTQGQGAHGGIGGGLIEGKLSRVTSVCNSVEVSGPNAFAGIGGGQVNHLGEVVDLTAINSSVRTMSDGANAGVGAGHISHLGEVNDIKALNSWVLTMGNNANAGVGAGEIECGQLNNITAVNSQVAAVGSNSSAGVGYAATGCADQFDAKLTDIRSVNTGVNFQTVSDTNISADTLCASADRRFVSSDCHVSSSLPAGTCPTPMPLFPATPLTLPTSTMTAAMATGLSTGAIAGIAAGVTALVAAGLGGVCLYRHYCREPGPEQPQQLLPLDDMALSDSGETEVRF
ncbi:hypothetical protein [Endozoicomonas sp. SCSIO W0465]|uniref:hypothetical protein n=1 Tax=Endozoicomonas sp. SCSIO W0465 TaxID=2918516 RepID=UPI002074D51C|nr:hypothetical protein [Endozoicomonas sp. SCSIO W0465]USE37147.1 hypothetical protein MJO57_02635 [Endozoicomonas sp. SCSIO W0465]